MSEQVIFEAPKINKPEFRLYYDEKGSVLHYTTEDLPGNYIVIDSQTFAESRYDVRVIDGEIVRRKDFVIVEKLVPSKEGKSCHSYDVSVIVDEDFIDIKRWSIKVYEYRT
jgi:hypothetical protein